MVQLQRNLEELLARAKLDKVGKTMIMWYDKETGEIYGFNKHPEDLTSVEGYLLEYDVLGPKPNAIGNKKKGYNGIDGNPGVVKAFAQIRKYRKNKKEDLEEKTVALKRVLQHTPLFNLLNKP